MSVKELIAYFLRNICAKNYQNQFMYVRLIARQSSDTFWDTMNKEHSWQTAHQQKECRQHRTASAMQLQHSSSHLDNQIEQKYCIWAKNYNIPDTDTTNKRDNSTPCDPVLLI